MEICPNCGATLKKDGSCPACRFSKLSKAEEINKLLKLRKFSEASAILEEILNENPNDGKSCLDMVRVLTKNFSEKPLDKEQCLDYAVRGLTYASDKDKVDTEFKLLAYFENLNLGGRSVENIFDIKTSVLESTNVYTMNTSSKTDFGADKDNSDEKSDESENKLK